MCKIKLEGCTVQFSSVQFISVHNLTSVRLVTTNIKPKIHAMLASFPTCGSNTCVCVCVRACVRLQQKIAIHRSIVINTSELILIFGNLLFHYLHFDQDPSSTAQIPLYLVLQAARRIPSQWARFQGLHISC
jgi:hypothetical protein